MLNQQEYKFIALGGGNETGGSCYAVKLRDSIIILDAGIRNTNNFLTRIPDLMPLHEIWGLGGLWEIDALILSHSHNDHTGALPVFFRNMNDAKIYSSTATPDMIYSQNNILRRNDTASILDMIITLPFNEKYYINDFALTLFPAGHITGAAMTLIENDECRVLYTGDFCDFDQFTVNGADIPEMKIDTLICETTYGYSQSIGRLDVKDLAGKINMLLNYTDIFTCTQQTSGKSIEIAAALDYCADNEMIPDIDIWLDKSCWELFRVFEKYGNGRKFSERVKFLDDERKIKGCVISTGNSDGLYELGVNMSNHADCEGILDIIGKTKPDRIIFVHGSPALNGTRNIIQEVHERFGASIELTHSINGREINLLKE